VNLSDQTITLLATGEKETFDISPYKKDNMMNGFDDIDYLQSIKPQIEEFALHLPL
jgi:3-isopropylmalate/(R)-2-methylmalate dehydratase small subunit